MEKARMIVSLLEGVVEGTMSAGDALRRWPDIDAETDDAIAQAWHDLSHYASDDDIRERDHKYAHYQRTRLRGHIDTLRKKYRI